MPFALTEIFSVAITLFYWCGLDVCGLDGDHAGFAVQNQLGVRKLRIAMLAKQMLAKDQPASMPGFGADRQVRLLT